MRRISFGFLQNSKEKYKRGHEKLVRKLETKHKINLTRPKYGISLFYNPKLVFVSAHSNLTMTPTPKPPTNFGSSEKNFQNSFPSSQAKKGPLFWKENWAMGFTETIFHHDFNVFTMSQNIIKNDLKLHSKSHKNLTSDISSSGWEWIHRTFSPLSGTNQK